MITGITSLNFSEIQKISDDLQNDLLVTESLIRSKYNDKFRNEPNSIRTMDFIENLFNRIRDISIVNLKREKEEFVINLSVKRNKVQYQKVYDLQVIEMVESCKDMIHDSIFELFGYYDDIEFSLIDLVFNQFYTEFKENNETELTDKLSITTTDQTNTKLIWKGQNNQLYSVLRQLKDKHELIGNSYESLAEFLIRNVTGFENTKNSTIETELKRNKDLPKPKRINIEPGEAE